MNSAIISRNAVQLTRKLIQIPSESSEPVSTKGPPEAGIISFLSKVCLENRIKFNLQEALPGRNNLVLNFPKPGAAKILFLAHMDTVSAKGMANPFRAGQNELTIHGRGACDDKGPLASLLASLIGMNSAGARQKFDVTCVCTVDEENTMAGAAYFAKSSPHKYDLCVALEPSLLQPITKHKGVYRCRILPVAADKGPSTSTQAHNNNPLKDIMADLHTFKEEMELPFDPQLGRPGVTITEIGASSPEVEDQSPHRVLVDIRMLPSQTPANMHRELSRIAGSRGKVIPLFAALGIDSDPSYPLIEKFRKNIAKAGYPNGTIAAPFPSDCSQLRGQRACLVWGPGNPKHAHTEKEHIEIEQIEGACRILTNFLFAS